MAPLLRRAAAILAPTLTTNSGTVGGFGSGAGSSTTIETTSRDTTLTFLVAAVGGELISYATGQSTSSNVAAASSSGGEQASATNAAGESAGGLGSGTGSLETSSRGAQSGITEFDGSGSGASSFAANGQGVLSTGNDGSVNGSSKGDGAAAGAGAFDSPFALGPPSLSATSSSFSNTAGGAGFVDGTGGSALGSTAAGSNGVSTATTVQDFDNVVSSESEFTGAVSSTGQGDFGATFKPIAAVSSSTKSSGSLELGNNGTSAVAPEREFMFFTFLGPATVQVSSTGSAGNFGGGQAAASNPVAMVGSLSSGTSSGAAGSGGVAMVEDNGMAFLGQNQFTGSGSATGNFDASGSNAFNLAFH